MATASIKFEDKKAKKYINKMLRKVDKITAGDSQFALLIAKRVIADVTDHFNEQQGGPGKLWPEWSEAYLKHMRKVGKQGNLILTDTARLRNSFTFKNWRKRDRGIEFFNNAKTKTGFPYAAAHNVGGPKLPKRRFMWLSKEAKQQIADDAVKYVEGSKGG